MIGTIYKTETLDDGRVVELVLRDYQAYYIMGIEVDDRETEFYARCEYLEDAESWGEEEWDNTVEAIKECNDESYLF